MLKRTLQLKDFSSPSLSFTGSLIVLCTLFLCSLAHAQERPLITGKVIQFFSREPIAFASVYWKAAGHGCITDSSGRFSLKNSHHSEDTLIISFVGFQDVLLSKKDLMKRQQEPVIQMETAKAKETAVVKTKFNKGLRWWRAIVAHKAENTPSHFNNYYCELYNKLEIDICNLSKSEFEKRKLLKPLAFVWDNVDSTSEEKPFLPVFLTESLSDYYRSDNPSKAREEIKALQTSGIKNESVMEYLGGINQKINSYDDYMTIFGKEFISPVSAVGDKYYHYKGADTQIIHGEKYFHLLFTPKQAGENVFTGDCWIHSTTWALQKISMEAGHEVNINFVQRLSIVQEFTRQNQHWIVSRDKFIVELSPFTKNNKLSFIGRKTSTYRQVQTDQPFIAEKLRQNHKKEEVAIHDSATGQTAVFWNQKRAEPLTLNEQHAMHLVDTLRSLPAFKKLSNTVTFIVDGHKKLGKIEIGPWYKWISGNQLEKLRLRFDLGTTPEFSKNLRLYGYLAYGVKDGAWKGKLAASYNLPGNHGWNIAPSFIHDLDNGRSRLNDEDVATDNMFSQLLRRQGIKQKFIRVNEVKLAVTKTFPNNFSIQTTINRSSFETFTPLPPKKMFVLDSDGTGIVNTEFGIKLRYAPGEKLIQTQRKTRAIKGNLPVTELRYSIALPDILQSEYRYQKLSANISQRFRIPRWGQVNYLAYAGKIFGKQVPFMLLEMHPGNEIYYYNKDAFNLMNRFEYISDEYGGFNIEHNFEKKLLNLLPFMRKSRMRQFWNIKTVWGSLSASNSAFNHVEFGSYHLRALRGHAYTEIGTGFDNIFRFFRIDAVWRLTPSSISGPKVQRFGIFGSFKLQF